MVICSVVSLFDIESLRQHSQSLPGKRGFPLNISAKIQPTDHTSIAFVYSLNVNMISGARYHLVATYSVIKPELSSCDAADRARPKSQTFRSQLAFNSRLDGFKSLWRTLAECIAFKARRVWYMKYWQWSSERSWVRITLCISVSINSWYTLVIITEIGKFVKVLNEPGSDKPLWKFHNFVVSGYQESKWCSRG